MIAEKGKRKYSCRKGKEKMWLQRMERENMVAENGKRKYGYSKMQEKLRQFVHDLLGALSFCVVNWVFDVRIEQVLY